MSQEGQVRLLDRHLGQFFAERSGLTGAGRRRFGELVSELSMAMAAGHSCLEIGADDHQLLAGSPLVSEAGLTPIIVDNGRLYLHRYHRYECRLADQLARLAAIAHGSADWGPMLDRWFGPDGAEVDYQKKAAEVALERSLCIISGGPGTGKTTTVVRIIGLLLEVFGRELKIALAAPTGKAAMRLQESIGRSLASLAMPDEALAAIPAAASTLHRLLGVRRHSPEFRHNHQEPLPWDVVVVDEASMVDLALMSKLVDALRPGARLILLGDRDQLASVESGSVLADCIRSLPDNTMELRKSYRFDHDIKALAEAIKQGDGEGAWQLLGRGGTSHARLLRNSYQRQIGERYHAYMQTAARSGELGIGAVFAAFSRFRVLCATRHGARGVQGVNSAVEKHLRTAGYPISANSWYAGRPILITSNDYSLELFNGDIGICLPDPDDGRLKVWFERIGGGFRACLPARISGAETAYAMTIHKSQGSEFREVLVLLPEDESRSLSRQLIYTAVTRAKECVEIVASKTIFVYALQSDYPRSSGLADRLRAAVANEK